MFSNSSFTFIEQRILDVVTFRHRPYGLSRLLTDRVLRISFRVHRDLLSTTGVVVVVAEVLPEIDERFVGVLSGHDSISMLFE